MKRTFIQATTKETLLSAQNLKAPEARLLVADYYLMQDLRKRTDSQRRALGDRQDEGVLDLTGNTCSVLEGDIQKALRVYATAHPIGQWLLSVTGVGPVIAAGLLANLDIEKAPTAGHFWSICGLAPGQRRERGKKLNFNPDLKTLVWNAGECFLKVCNNPNDRYGHEILRRREYEQRKNEVGDYADQAAAVLATKKIGKDTEAYKWYSQGKLPPAHILARSKRWAVKLFLAHLHEVWYTHQYGEAPPLPYPIAILGHAHRDAA